MGSPILQVRGLVKQFRGFQAVDDVDLDIEQGSVHALVGPNGAGKTTLFNLLTGFLRPTRGRITLDSQDITGLSPDRVARLGVARSFQITTLFPQVTAREHVELALQARTGLGWRFWRSESQLGRFRDRAVELLGDVGLADAAEVPAAALAYGRKRALELAVALALEPRVLLLDEPTAGMGAEDVERTIALIGKVRAANQLVKEYAAKDSGVDYIDVYTPMLGQNGLPRPELFREDSLHLSSTGYALWRSVIRPFVR